MKLFKLFKIAIGVQEEFENQKILENQEENNISMLDILMLFLLILCFIIYILYIIIFNRKSSEVNNDFSEIHQADNILPKLDKEEFNELDKEKKLIEPNQLMQVENLLLKLLDEYSEIFNEKAKNNKFINLNEISQTYDQKEHDKYENNLYDIFHNNQIIKIKLSKDNLCEIADKIDIFIKNFNEIFEKNNAFTQNFIEEIQDAYSFVDDDLNDEIFPQYDYWKRCYLICKHTLAILLVVKKYLNNI